MPNVRRILRSLAYLIGVMGLIVFAAPGALAHALPSSVVRARTSGLHLTAATFERRLQRSRRERARSV